MHLAIKMKSENFLKKFWEFLKEDSWLSWLVSLILIILAIRFIFFPLISLITGASLPLVIVESCSMYHSSSFDDWWNMHQEFYAPFNISKEDFADYKFSSGLSKGDIILVLKSSSYNKGDIIIFAPNNDSSSPNPIIHRIVVKNDSIVGTKGDNNNIQLKSGDSLNPSNIDETAIINDRIYGKAVAKIPLLGWVKLIFFEFSRSSDQRGFCH